MEDDLNICRSAVVRFITVGGPSRMFAIHLILDSRRTAEVGTYASSDQVEALGVDQAGSCKTRRVSN